MATDKPLTSKISSASEMARSVASQAMTTALHPLRKTEPLAPRKTELAHRMSEVAPPSKSELMSAIAPIKSHLAKGERHMFSQSEESAAVVKLIQNFHAQDEGYAYDYDPHIILNIIEEIILRTSTIIPGVEQRIGTDSRLDELEREALRNGFTHLSDELPYPVHQISFELICKCHGGGDVRKVTEELFQILANFSWEAKVVIAFAAFAMLYGEFWLVAHLYRSFPLAKSVGLLMRVPEIMGNAEAYRGKFKSLSDLINLMLDVTKSIIEFNDLLSKHNIAHDAEEQLAASLHVPTAAYWTVKSIVACSAIQMNLMAMGHEYITTAMEAWELSTLGHKLGQIKTHLHEVRIEYTRKLEEKRQHDLFLALKDLFRNPYLVDNMKILRTLIYAKDDLLPLYDGTHKIKKSLEELRRKTVVLLISGLDIPPQEFDILRELYVESRDPLLSHEHRFEIVWLPFIDRTKLTPEILQTYEAVQHKMPWYSVAHPSLIEPGVIRFVKEEWRYKHKPLFVVLDPDQGKVSNYDAMDMYWIWGTLAFPFTGTKEKMLWEQSYWNIDLLLDSIDPTLHSWLLSGNTCVCVFGGEDIEWIKKFTTTVKTVATELNVPLQLAYVGRSTMKDKVRKNMELIQRNDLSFILPDSNNWFFWVRLNCMLTSREKFLEKKLMEFLERHGMFKEKYGVSVVYDEVKQQIAMFKKRYDGRSIEYDEIKNQIDNLFKEKLGISVQYDELMNQITNDEILRQIMSILTYDSSNIDWVVFGRGLGDVETAKHRGDLVLECLERFNHWRHKVVDSHSFVRVLNEELQNYHPGSHCYDFTYVGSAGTEPPIVHCPECNKYMDKYITYRCCHD